ncbi:MGMT family protein [Aquibacillus koreensis]|uniref:MGMT family protein n=1 Tax=Aquibacillus koreensis TaxID=279446 RepID=A0A9X3WKA4_9BACI|nr:MGMT family protein [Aquibacillus koreensis]MCT2535739.1 MGMT family protein [Aquibacillus koreensis]MDC3420195.1 MGMT family protein [Aquibacillus koreensis]
MNSFTDKAISIIKSIPEGQVMTYGQIARSAGNPHGARQVARLLHTMSKKHGLPWHRVINSKGEISLNGEGFETQKYLLEKEGIAFSSNSRINLTFYQYEFAYSE